MSSGSPLPSPPNRSLKFPVRSTEPSTKHVLLVTTGSVASVKVPLIVKELLKYKDVQVQVASTKPSLSFFSKSQIEEEHNDVRVWTDDDEWNVGDFVSARGWISWSRMGDPILHIQLRRWADVILIAPCSANTLSKLASGACDNLITSILRATPPTTPTYLFPAMNTQMYLHPLTASHLSVASDLLGYTVVGPIGKGLACGDTGTGAMTEWLDIVHIIVNRFELVPKVAESEVIQ